MKNYIGVVLIIIGLALVLTEGNGDPDYEEQATGRDEAGGDRGPEAPEDGSTISIQPVLGVVFLLTGAGILIYAYNNESRKSS
ncbi:MAG: hypothetical protein WD266_13655 [Balneolales bacterium]